MRIFGLFAIAVAVSSPALANKLITANTPVLVAKSDLQATSTRDWNKLNARPGRNSETWTLDGELLNDLSFYGGIQNGKTLFREVDKKNRPLPRFNKTMLFTDIPALLENSYRIARDVTIFTLETSEPLSLMGSNGIRFTYSFIGPDELRRNGEAHAAIVNGRLYMTTFEAPTIYYFENDIESYRQIAGSLKLAKPK